MELLTKLGVGLVAFIHLFTGVVEMFLWINPKVHERLRPKVVVNADEARKVAPIVANVGLYNWFLAMGLIWSLLPSSLGLLPTDSVFPVQVFFLGCVMVAGIYGGFTVSKNTLIIQTTPAAIALLLAWFGTGS